MSMTDKLLGIVFMIFFTTLGFVYGWIMRAIQEKDKADKKKGEWTKESLCGYRCNQCGKIQMADDINELNFCCNCGADMRGKGDEDI